MIRKHLPLSRRHAYRIGMETNPVIAYGRWLAEAPARWPAEALRAAHHALIDGIGVSVLGAREDAAQRVFAAVKDWGEGPATAIGMGARLAAPWAALVNGTTAHALDFDDMFDPGKAHATAVLMPAILALAQQEGASGAACLDAYVAGLQILGRVGEGLNPGHRQRGWHATATVGAIGAAAACARLLRLGANQASHALSIATSMAGGSIAQFGTMAKPLHAGLAAQAGVMAASLAREGIDAGRDTLGGRTSMQALMGAGSDSRFEVANVGEPLLILSHGLRAKRYPNCGSAHRATDGLLELKAAHRFAAADVQSIAVQMPRTHLGNLMYEDPQTPLQAKFSLHYALALALVEGGVGLQHFSEQNVRRQDLRALYPLIRGEPLDDSGAVPPNRIAVRLKDGRAFETTVANAVGSRAKPFTAEQYWEKFKLCTSALPPERAARLRTALEAFERLDNIATLMEVLAEA
jgi:2-methylcitrate dehydratase PrpD